MSQVQVEKTVRLYGIFYGCISLLFGFVLWFAWSEAHVLYALPKWAHIWVLSWLHFALMLVGAAGAIVAATGWAPTIMTDRQGSRSREWEPFLLAGAILSSLALIAAVFFLLDVIAVS